MHIEKMPYIHSMCPSLLEFTCAQCMCIPPHFTVQMEASSGLYFVFLFFFFNFSNVFGNRSELVYTFLLRAM